MASHPEIDIEACRRRQRRLLDVMQRLNLDLVIVNQIEHVQYLAGPRFAWTFSPAAALERDGRLTLVAPGKPPERAAADTVVCYTSNSHGTLRNDQRMASCQILLRALGSKPGRRIGVEFSSCGPHITGALGAEWVDVEPELYVLRSRKDADELVLLCRAIAAMGAMYARAREIIEPSLNELTMFNELNATAVSHCGELLTGMGNDFASGVPGGPPRDRKIEAGELYILDLGPAYRGYFGDTCRTIAVDRRPTDLQMQAWEKVVGTFELVERSIRPGVSCRSVFEEVSARLDQCEPWKFGHHLGHGIGLFPHEAPHLNPQWDDVFEVGNVFTFEPGLYHPELRGGIRLENNYLLTANGVELLSPFPLEL